LELLTKACILLNLERYKKDKNNPLLSFRDIYEVLDDMLKEKKSFLPSFNKEITMLFTSSDALVQTMANGIVRDLETLRLTIKENKQFHITALTKVKDFHNAL